ncbi:MAG: hypothetical protein J3Q66DRAFT_331127 [Benniella sp.]|nr:MAG: hypothetical protein J3Q66DRAFT_331127 [Benniella sp.]
MTDSLYTIKDTPDRGRGMFATQDIKRGTCVISESPLLYISQYSMAENLAAVEALSKKNKKSFFSLYNAHADLGVPQDFGIIRTNALPRGADSCEGAVYRVISRINHSCVPNVAHSWSPKTKKENVYAIKDIPAGSEILTSYLPRLMTRVERQKALAEFRFTCRCEVCNVESSQEHDAAVERIEVCTSLMVSCCTSNNPRKAIGYVHEILSLLDKIGEWRKTEYYYDGYQIYAMYCNYKLAKEWADLTLEACRMEEGEDGENYGHYLALSQNPKGHELAGTRAYVHLPSA